MPLPASISDATAALRRRRDLSRRQRWRRVALAVVALVVVAALTWLVAFSPVLATKRVEVEGTQLLTPAEVRAAARVPLGTPLTRVDTDAIAARVQALLPVAQVEVDRHWPNTITIKVTERTAVLQRQQGSGFQWIDGTGLAFHTSAQAKGGTLHVRAPNERRLLTDLATVSSSLTTQLRQRVQYLKADSPDTITLVLDKGQQVVWGSADQSATKAQVATALLGVKATVFDVSAPDHPTSR